MIGHVNKYLSHSPIIGDVIISYLEPNPFKYEIRELFNDGNDIRPVVTLCLSESEMSPYNPICEVCDDNRIKKIKNRFRFDEYYTNEITLLGKLFSIDILNVPQFNMV
tara:strand:+ start:1929 stop:2252 length:324 start_codon:yes stop_codon:yes gene_type:complete